MNILSIDAATKTGWASNIFGRRSGITEFALKRGEPGLSWRACGQVGDRQSKKNHFKKKGN
jgi:hypothetical protein